MKTSAGPFGITYRHITVVIPGFQPYEYKVAASVKSPVSLLGIGLEVLTMLRQQLTTADEKTHENSIGLKLVSWEEETSTATYAV